MSLQAVVGGLDVTGLDVFGSQWSVDKFDGWGTSKPTIQVLQKPRQPGGWAGLSYGSARTMGLTGQVASQSQDALTQSLDLLAASVSKDDTVMQVVEGSRTRFVTVRRSGEILTAYISDKMASWSIQVVAADPRKMWSPLVKSTALRATSGGLTIPFTIPFTINSTVVSGDVALTNGGTTTGPVVLRIDGPCTGPSITHTSATTTSALTFSSSLSLGVGEWLTVDMDAHTVLANDQASRANTLSSRGWSGFDPGANLWSFTATTYNAASMLTVTATPADE